MTRILLAAFALLAALVLAIPSAGLAAPAANGTELFNRGAYREAAAAFSREAARRPGDLGARIDLAVALLQLKDYSGAAHQLELAIRLAPDVPVLGVLLQNVQRLRAVSVPGVTAGSAARGRVVPPALSSKPRAVGKASPAGALQRAAEARPSSAALANLVGDAYQLAGDTASAREWYTRAARLAPGWARPQTGLAVAVLDTDPVQSVNLLEGVVKMEPANGQALLWLGDAYQRLGRKEQAEACYRRAASDPAAEADARVRIATQLLRENKVEQADANYQMAQRSDPSNVAASAGLAITQTMQQQLPAARSAIENARAAASQMSPVTESFVYLNAGKVEAEAGEFQTAGVYFEKAVELHPAAQAPYRELVLNYQRQGTLGQNLSAVRQRLRAGPRDESAWRTLVEGCRLTGDTQGELAAAKALEELDSRNAWSWKVRQAEALWKSGRRDDALRMWLDAVDAGYPVRTLAIAASILQTAGQAPSGEALERAMRPASRRNGLHLRFALEQSLGNNAKALAFLEDVISLDPDNATLHGQRAFLLEALGRNEEAGRAYARQRELIQRPQSK